MYKLSLSQSLPSSLASLLPLLISRTMYIREKDKKYLFNFSSLVNYVFALKIKLFLPLPLLISSFIPKLTQINPKFKKRPVLHFKPISRPV